VRLPDRYYSVFRDALPAALRCWFVVDYNIGRRRAQLLATTWTQVSFDEKCIVFPATKQYPHAVKAPFFGEMEPYLKQQFERRNRLHTDCPWVFSWFDYRSDMDGKRIVRFDQQWNKAVESLAVRMKGDGLPDEGEFQRFVALRASLKGSSPAATLPPSPPDLP
jgi:hypothetical protein